METMKINKGGRKFVLMDVRLEISWYTLYNEIKKIKYFINVTNFKL